MCLIFEFLSRILHSNAIIPNLIIKHIIYVSDFSISLHVSAFGAKYFHFLSITTTHVTLQWLQKQTNKHKHFKHKQ